MTIGEVTEFVGRICNELGLRYAIEGSVASFVYGEVRMTRDVDIVIELDAAHLHQFLQYFPRPDFYVDERTVAAAVQECSQFNIIHVDSGTKIDVYLPSSEIEQGQVARARRVLGPRVELRYSPPEELIVKKLQFYQAGDTDRHLRDIVGILYRTGDGIDLDRHRRWFDSTALRSRGRRFRINSMRG